MCDETIENLYNTLRTINQLDNTYIVFTSDNGFHLGQHRLPAGKQTAYEEDIHLPLIVRGPDVPQGQIVQHLTGNIDLAPTFADWAGAKAPEFIDGRSLAPLLRSKPPAPSAWRQAFLVEHWLESNQPQQRNDTMLEPIDHDQSAKIQNAKRTASQQRRQARQSLAGDRIPEFHGLRTNDYTYVEYITGEREFYDLKNDPAQLNNLAETVKASLLKEFAGRLAKLKNCRGAECRMEEDKSLAP